MMTERPDLLRLKQIVFAYPGAAPILKQVSLSLAQGDFHCLVGRSGCGKTTLLKIAAGLLAPSAGRVEIAGRPLNGPSRQIGFVFQRPSLLEWRTVLDNVLLPVFLQRSVTAEDRAAAHDLLAQMGIEAHAGRHPHQLSGGQQARVALARALITRPPMLLMDEPFAALDAITREELQADLRRMTRAQNTMVLFVTHDISEAVFLASHVSVMTAGQITHSVTTPQSANEDRHPPGAADLCCEIRAALMASSAEDPL